MASRSKKRKLHLQLDDAKVKELEEFLFSSSSDAVKGFGDELNRNDEAVEILHSNDHNREGLLVWEDRGNLQRQGSLDPEPAQADDDQSSSDDLDDEADTRSGSQQPDVHPQRAAEVNLENAAGTADSRLEIQQHESSLAGSRCPAWNDPDDNEAEVEIAGRNRLRKLRQTEDEKKLTGGEYEQRLRQLHARMNPRTSWAIKGAAARQQRQGDYDDSDGEDATDRFLAGTERLLGRGAQLPPRLLEVSRLADANKGDLCKGVVRSVEFHPSGQLLMTASLDKRLRFFQVDGVRNEKVQSVYLEDLPIHQGAFANDGKQVVAVGRRKYFYIIDLASSSVERVNNIAGCADKSLERFAASSSGTGHGGPAMLAFLGNRGTIPLVSLQTRQSVGQLKMNNTVLSATFAADGTELLTSGPVHSMNGKNECLCNEAVEYSATPMNSQMYVSSIDYLRLIGKPANNNLGSDGVVHTWDMRTQRCLQRDVDKGTLKGTSLALSPSSRTLATGSDSGVVNLYERSNPQAATLAKNPKDDVAHLLARSQALMPHYASHQQPVKSFMNLTTAVDSLAFSPDGQMLAMASRLTKDALRMAHIPSKTVFENWPTANSPLNFVHSLAFSPGGGFLAIGNARGRALLYRLHHYDQL